MGKATLAYMIARETKANINRAHGPVVGELADLTPLLTELEEGDFLLIEQIESIKEPALEAFMAAIEDFTLELPTDQETESAEPQASA